MPGRLWRYWKDWTADCRCGMKGASPLPRRHPPVRYFSETATSVPHLFLSRPQAPTAWANAGQRLSNHWTQGQRKRRIKGPSLAAGPQLASPKPPLRAGRRSFRRRDGRRSRKPSAGGCRFEQLRGSWESTEPPSRNTRMPKVLRRGKTRRVPRHHNLIPSQSEKVTFMLNT